MIIGNIWIYYTYVIHSTICIYERNKEIGENELVKRVLFFKEGLQIRKYKPLY